ncbi:zinc protease [Rhodovulum imhoffii]|uniref:Zinc protease n=1 Tax=Rhodovulum imhoffii TaxID=365340 RepID=A0A2T5BV03_9RHOB|nr:pitrilysin family protein [Rhodovulum imhoffii]MBK5934666.1 peptidase M16 [Rhodovulum imhoffii]PTN03359.1 zinc protease [Rhodovulum imhoffii]
MLRIFVLCLVLACPLQAAPVTSFSLENGLQVVVIEDHRAPVAVNMVWYRVGAADEAPGKSGLAHFLEHLMFKGTDTVGPGEFSATVAAQGGADNAFTSWDYTAYYQRFAADRLEMMIRMEADRMANLRLAQTDVETEREVILEERGQRTDNDPGALFSEQRRAAQFLNHPYGIPIIGWRHEMAALTREDALAFYRAHYVPDNAVLVVAGDVDPQAVRQMAQAHFGPLAAAGVMPRQRPQEPPQISARRLTLVDARVGQPYLARSYLAPGRGPGAQERAAALVYLAELLGGEGADSRLGEALQFDRQLAVYTGAFYDGLTRDDTEFSFVVVPAAGVGLAQAEAALDEVLAEFLQNGVTPERFGRVKTRLRAADIYARDNVQDLAYLYGQGLAIGLSVEDIAAWPGLLQQVTPEDVMEVARIVLRPEAAVTGYLARPEQEASQ